MGVFIELAILYNKYLQVIVRTENQNGKDLWNTAPSFLSRLPWNASHLGYCNVVFDPFHWVFQEEKERKGRDYGRIM